jgi:hypothetical protein
LIAPRDMFYSGIFFQILDCRGITRYHPENNHTSSRIIATIVEYETWIQWFKEAGIPCHEPLCVLLVNLKLDLLQRLQYIQYYPVLCLARPNLIDFNAERLHWFRHLRNRLLDQGYKQIRLIRSLKKFIFRYQDLVEIYSVSAEKIISDAFSYSENV